MNHLVIDLEMCKVPKHYRTSNYNHANEIIQIGAVLLDENFEIIKKINQYVRPKYGVLDHFITNLTGIENHKIKNAPLLEEVLLYMQDWLGECEYKIYAWSPSDYSQLKHEIVSKNITGGRINEFMNVERWIDYQQVYGKRFDIPRSVSLEEALVCCNIDVDGRLHDGLDDAANTAKLIKLLEQNPDFVLCQNEIFKEKEEEPLKFSLGDLFAGLDLSCFA